MIFLLAGEGPTDIGGCRDQRRECSGADFESGPLAVMVRQIVDHELGKIAAGWELPDDAIEFVLSQIIARLNELFITDNLSEQDLVNYAYTVRDKVRENEKVMSQLANNTDEQAMLGDFPKAVDDAILDSSAAHENQKLQLLSDPKKAAAFAKLVFDLIKMAG